MSLDSERLAGSSWLGGVIRLLPGPGDYRGLRSSWRGDVVAGLTVGVVALPLALAFGITTGLGAAVGLTTAIVAGFVAAIFGGSSLQVSGPTGAMAVVLVPIVARYGPGSVFTVGLLAGVIVLVAAVVRLGRAVAYIPWPVIEGFTVGIAVIIFLQQVPGALGVAKPAGQNTAVVAARAVRVAATSWQWQPLLIVGIVAAVMIVLPRLHRSVPASLLAVVVATLIASGAGWQVARIGALPHHLPAPSMPDLGTAPHLLSAALAVAVLASIESLLSAKVADGMADLRPSDPDRELIGQGLANVASAVFGGMPATGAIARTAVNARAGARTRLAAVIHSITLLAIVLFAGSLVARIPLAALAGVLIVTAVRMVDVRNVRSVLRSTRSDALVLVLTATATVAFDLITAIEIGILVAGALALRHLANSTTITAERLAPEVTDEQEHDLLAEHILIYRIDGPLFFGASQRFLTELTAVSDVRVVILRLAELQSLDASAAHSLGAIVDELEHRHITVLLKGTRAEHLRILRTVGALDRLTHENHIFDNLDQAISHARRHADQPALHRAAS
jgi:SulP family sulfate permease